ncbi:MAG: hypothetical protein ACFCU4_06610 [Puniceicoccaceae bacterium]
MKLLLPLGVLLFVLGTGYFVVRPQLESRFSGKGDFPAAEFVFRPMNFVGNRYVLAGSVEAVIGNREGLGRVVVVRTETTESPLPIFVPENLPENLNFGQRYIFQVRVREGGLIYAEEMEKR